MADVTKLVLNRQTYIIKDSVARSTANSANSLANTANSTANSAKSTAESANATASSALTSANNAVQRLDELSAEYSASTETINFNINV